jgi:1-hydroxycarotenoid 3,4-desaturase
MAEKAVVIGAGMGGLNAAISLAARGLEVEVFEAQPQVGGKLRQVNVGGQVIDAGPTVFTMRWVFEKLFADAGLQFHNYVTLDCLDTLAHHRWNEVEQLDLFADQKKSTQAIARFSSTSQAKKYAAFCAHTKRLLDALQGPFMASQRPSLLGLVKALGPHGLAVLSSAGPFFSMWRTLARYFDDPRLQQLFGRYATYCGSSPWQAPATMNLIAQVEQQGVWSVRGGMIELARGLRKAATDLGVVVHTNESVSEIKTSAGQLSAVGTSLGRQVNTRLAVFNGDLHALASGLLGAQAAIASAPVAFDQRALSAITWMVLAPRLKADLPRHTVLFDQNYASEFADIFVKQRLPTRPTVYICAQDRDTGHTSGQERLLILVNAPAMGDGNNLTQQDILACEHKMKQQLQRCGLPLDWDQAQIQRCTPAQFHQLFPASGGALYGRKTHSWMEVFKRPGASTPIPGLFLAGGGVHPGAGVPMASLSGQLAAAALMAHLDSTRMLMPVATFGGTSTPSVITDSTA